MNSKQRKIFDQIFEIPVRSAIRWTDIEALFRSLGAEIEERKGSRIVVKLNDEAQVFHRPHPKPETSKGAVTAVRIFLEKAGIK